MEHQGMSVNEIRRSTLFTCRLECARGGLAKMHALQQIRRLF